MSTKVFSLVLPVSASCVRSRQWVVEVKAAGGVLASLHKSACCANGGEDRLDPYLDLLRPRCLDIFRRQSFGRDLFDRLKYASSPRV